MDFSTSLEKAMMYEQQGRIQQAFHMYQKALEESGDNSGPVLFQMGIFLFSLGRYEEALDMFVETHRQGYRCEEVETLVFEAYFAPNVSHFQETYLQNIKALQSEHLSVEQFPTFESLRYRFIPYNDHKYVIFDNSTKKFISIFENSAERISLEGIAPKVYLLRNEFNFKIFYKLVEQNILPLYLFYDDIDGFIQYLQVFTLQPLINHEKVVLLLGNDDASRYFACENVTFPLEFMNVTSQDEIYRIVEQCMSNQIQSKEISYQNLMNIFERYLNSCK